ncbi:MAG: hypothetical protein V1747_09785 [Candidatus Omnitrophota bacterium]
MWKKIIIISSIIFIGIIGIGFIYLNNVYIPQHLKPLVIELMEKNLAKKVNIDKAFYFPFKGVLFSGIYIENIDGSPFLQVDKVDLSLKSFPKIKPNQVSLKARLIVKGIALSQQGLAVKGSSIVDFDLALAEGKEPVFKADIRLDDLEARGLRNIADIVKINGNIICDQASFSAADLNAYISGQQLNIFFNGRYSKNDIEIEQFKINFGKTNLEIKARIEDLKKLNLKASAAGLIDFADINKLLSIESLPVLVGQCKIIADASGLLTDLNSFKAKVLAEITQGSVDKIKFSDLKAELNFVKAELNLAPVYCTFYQGKISAGLKAQVKDSLLIQGSVDIEQVNIQPLIRDILGQDMGNGQFNAHVGISGNAADLNNLKGSGWFKVEQAALKPPPNFNKVAKTLGVSELADMRVEQSSATFSLIDGKIQTEDFIAVADYATLYGKGYIDLEQYVNFEVRFKLSDQLGGMGQIANLAADGAKVKLYDKLSQLKYKVDFSAEDMIKNQSEQILKGLFDQSNNDPQNQSNKIDVQQQLKQGLKKLFK